MKKILAILLSLAVVLAMTPSMVFADTEVDSSGDGVVQSETEYVAAIGEQEYQTLQAAIDAVQTENQAIVLLKDNSESVVIAAGKIVTIDLNGKKLTNNESTTTEGYGQKSTIVNFGTITIKDTSNEGTGKVDNVTNGAAALYNGVNATAVLNGGIFDRSAEVGTNSNGGGNSWYTICNHGTMTVNNGVKVTTASDNEEYGKFSSLFENGYQSGDVKTQAENKSSADEKKLPMLTINGGLFNGGLNTIKNDDYAKLEINSGTFKNFVQTCVQNHNIGVIDGGTYEPSGDAVAVYNCGVCKQNYDGDAHQLTITGGVFYGSIKKTVGEVSITGGTFSDFSVLPYVANDKEVTIKLAGDVTEQQIIPAGKIVILDLNGKTISHTEKTIINNGTLTIKDTVGNGKVISTGHATVRAGDNSVTTIKSGIFDSVHGAVITGTATGATITIDNGKFSASNNAVIAGNGTERTGNPNNIIINNGEFTGEIETTGEIACGIYSPWKDNITVNNGTFNITGGAGIVARAGIINVKGGTFICTGDTTGKVGDSRVVVPCAPIVFDSEANYPALTSGSGISILGGSFSGEYNNSIVLLAENDENASKRIIVKKGIFSSNPKQFVPESEYDINKSDENWIVSKQVTYYSPVSPTPQADLITNDGGNAAAGTVPTTTVDTKPVTTTEGGVKTTTAAVNESTGKSLVDNAVKNESAEIVVDATTSNANASIASGAKTEVALTENTVKELAEKTSVGLDIKTDNAVVSLDAEAVNVVAKQAGTTGEVKLTVETVKADNKEVRIEVKLETSNGAVTNFGGGNVRVTVPVTNQLKNKKVVCVYVDDNGKYTKMDGTLNADGTYTFVTNHFSIYAIMEEAEADKVIAAQRTVELNTLIKEIKFKASTKYTSKKNVKVTAKVTAGDIAAITDMGYRVEYAFSRAEKKDGTYYKKKTSTDKTYINTTGKKGKKYYYRVQLYVYDGDALVGKSELKQSEYGVRTWKK